jgi:hypothetical protein
MVLSLGVYAYHPRYEPPSRAWRRAQTDFRTSNHPHTFQGWHDYLADNADQAAATLSVPTAAIGNAPTVVLPTLVHAEQAPTQYGAEHWGDLLTDMSTEERSIYSAEILQVYQETKAVERPFLDGLDAAVERFHAAMAELDGRHSAMYVGMGVNLAKRHGGGERWSTGQYAILPTHEPEPA